MVQAFLCVNKGAIFQGLLCVRIVYVFTPRLYQPGGNREIENFIFISICHCGIFATPARHVPPRGRIQEKEKHGRRLRMSRFMVLLPHGSGRPVRASSGFNETIRCIQIGIVVSRSATTLHEGAGMSLFIEDFS